MIRRLDRIISKPAGGLALASALVLVVAFLAHSSVPIYDGLGFPDEPYRYVDRPPNTKPTKTVTKISQSYPVTVLGNESGILALSGEVGPQISVRLGKNSVKLSQQASSIKVQAVPLSPKGQPQSRDIIGNVYKISFSSDKGDVKFLHDNRPYLRYILLRLPQGYEPLIADVAYRTPDGKWQKLLTSRYGVDIYQADLVDGGYYAMLKKQGYAAVATKKIVTVLGVSLVIVPLLVILVIRRRETKRTKKKSKK